MKSNARMARWLVLPLLLALLAGCGSGSDKGKTSESKGETTQAAAESMSGSSTAEAKKATPLTQGFKDEKTGLTMKVPSGWAAAPYEDALVVFLSPTQGDEDLYQENILLTYDDQFKNLTMINYLKALSVELRKRYPDTKTLESGEIEIDGQTAHWMVDSFTGNKGPAMVYRVVIVKDSAAYVLHATAPAQIFDRYRPTFESMARSIAWPKAAKP